MGMFDSQWSPAPEWKKWACLGPGVFWTEKNKQSCHRKWPHLTSQTESHKGIACTSTPLTFASCRPASITMFLVCEKLPTWPWSASYSADIAKNFSKPTLQTKSQNYPMKPSRKTFFTSLVLLSMAPPTTTFTKTFLQGLMKEPTREATGQGSEPNRTPQSAVTIRKPVLLGQWANINTCPGAS